MTNIRINETKRTIEVNGKAFAKKASTYGTEEYKMLQEARKVFPSHFIHFTLIVLDYVIVIRLLEIVELLCICH